MKKLLCILFLFNSIATSDSARAAEPLASDDNGFYAAVATGRLDFDFDGQDFRLPNGSIARGSGLNIDVDSRPPLRLSAGYNWGRWAFEATFENMVGSADMEIGTVDLGFDYSNFTLGGVYRSSGQIYLLGKFGISMPDIESTRTGMSLKLGNSGYVGAGIGYRFESSMSLEFDYTQTNDDTGAFMLGLRKHF